MTDKKRTRGRPTKLTPSVQDTICQFIAAGNYIGVACKAAGIDHATYDRWLVKAEQNKSSIYAKFAEAVKRAESEAETRNVLLIAKMAAGGSPVRRTTRYDRQGNVVAVDEQLAQPNWQAAAWLLERKNPERWGRRERQEVVYPDGAPQPTFIIRGPNGTGNLTADELAERSKSNRN